MIDRLHLKPKHREVLEAFLQKCLPGVEVWAYGSRINGRSHNGSDLDLVLRGPGLKEIPAGRLADFEEALRESLIPFLVEARDWARLPERFHREVEREYVVLMEGKESAVVSDDWAKVTLGEFAPFSYGKGLRKDMRNPAGHIPVFGSNGHVGWHDKALTDGPTVIVGRKGTVGAVHYSSVPCWPIDTTFFISGDEAGLVRFRYYALNTLGLGAMNADSAVPGLNREASHVRELRVPPLPEQRAIAHVLGTLDDKIELNRRMNETLEAMARAIFKNWFADFGPVRAKMEGREPYLPSEIWVLFPDALDDEDRPVGWDRGILADVAESPRRGIRPADVSDDTPYIGLEHMPRRSIALSEWEGAGKVKSNKTQFHRGEILFGKLRPYFHKVGIAPLDGICSTDIVVAVPRAQEWGAFTLACLSSDEFVDYTDRTSTGTKMPRTSWKTMAQYKLCLPPRRIVWAFQSIVRPLFDRLGANIYEASALTHTRDLLLPKLLSGEIRLREAEKAVEATA